MKKAISIEKQIALLKSRGVIISDEEKAKEVLLDIGYFRLCSYFFPFEKTYPKHKERTHEFVPGTNFDDAVALYYFDFDLRHVLIRYISRIEVAFRTYLTYYISNQYENIPCWFVNKKIVAASYARSFKKEVYTEKFKLNPVISRHHSTHNCKYAPAWKTIEYMTFGAVLHLYNNLIVANDSIQIAHHFNVRQVVTFKNYMETLRIIRNACAHGSVLFDMKMPKSIMRGPAGAMSGNERYTLKGMLDVCHYMIGQVSQNRAKDMLQQVNQAYQTLQTKAPDIYERIVSITGYRP